MAYNVRNIDADFHLNEREAILRQIFDRICSNLTQGPQSCAIVAPPLFGKTTVLNSIIDENIQELYKANHENLGFVFINCADAYLTRADALKSFGSNLSQALKPHHLTECLGFINKLVVTTELEHVKYLLDEMMAYLNRENVSIVFVLDHFEIFLSLFTADDIQFLRELLVKTKHAFIVAIPKPLSELTPKTFPSKFYLLFLSIFIKNLSDELAREYVYNSFCNTVIKFSDQDIDKILTRCGRHPYFLSVFISEALGLAKPEIDWLEIDQKVEKNLRQNFLKLWQDIPTDLQQTLSKLARGDLNQSENLKLLQKLEDEFGVLYRTKYAEFEVQGDIFKKFIISQADILAQFAKTDYFRAGVNALGQLQNEQYWGTDPVLYYKRAFFELNSAVPNYESFFGDIKQAFEQLIDALVKRSEPHVKKLFTGVDIKDKLFFLRDALEIDETMNEFLQTYFKIINTKITSDSQTTYLYNAMFRMYTLSAVSQLLINSNPRYTIFSNHNAFDAEYEIVDTIGETGHSIVYKAKHKIIQTRYVVAKTVIAKGFTITEVTELRERLLREAQIIASLTHPNIGRIYHIVLEPLTLIMEWIEGDSLEDILPSESLTTKEVIRTGIKLANALKHIHNRNIFHRDIKPSNIVFNTSHEPVLIDFDIAKWKNQGTITELGELSDNYLGTEAYSAPEQWDSPNNAGAKSDIFSLGIVLYELLTQGRPYETNHIKLDGQYPKIRQYRLDDRLYNILCNMLHPNFEFRPDAANVEEQLDRYLETLS